MNYYRNIDTKQTQFDFMFFENSDNSYEEEILNNGGKVFKVQKPSIGLGFKKTLGERFKKINKNCEYSILHIHTPYLVFLISKQAKRNGFKYIIGHSHATTYSDHFLGKVRNFIIKKMMFKRYITNYMTCSIAASDFLYGKKEFKKGNVYLLNNAVSIKDFAFNELTRNIYQDEFNSKDKIILGHVGRLENQKNHMFLLEVFKLLDNKSPNKFKLILVGNGSLEKKIKDYIEKNQLLDKVVLTGFRSDVDELLNVFDIFLLPSLFEGLPVVAIEAQTNGLPVILSNKITKEVGLRNYQFLNIRDSNQWVEAILNTKIERNSNIDIIKENNYDIKEEANKLTSYYISLRED